MWLFKGRHGRWQERLSAYLDAQLEPSEQRKLEQHLTSCTSCQEELESLLRHRCPAPACPAGGRAPLLQAY